ncbi:hypothetical protein DOTSEDRAFT_70724 [Dothistroma septosporum NZE10]|uniref:Mid2 domain-containing protein n=1 Tax=Dothistroma septosporum (strain NZE10 / CBS 128990) TaxID=675120 RepID=N1PXA5_DOTSN|nr:hypothetical protein DOTSEDRAFT_70724 [Dothistroma septosporum NZE10]
MYPRWLFPCIAILTSLATSALAQGENHFINPPIPGATNVYIDNKNFSIGATVELEWTTTYPMISLILWQNDNASYYTLIDNQPATQSFSWPIDLMGVFDLRNGAVFFFQMWNLTNNGNGQSITDRFSSHYFNLVNDGTTSTATATATPTGVVGTASSLPNPTASSTSTSASTPSSPPDSGLSTGAKAGIGIGVALGVLALIGATAAFWFLRRRKSARYTPARSNPDSPPPMGGNGKYDMPMEQQHGQSAPGYNTYGGGPLYAQDVKGQYSGVGEEPVEMAATQAAPVEMSADSALGPRELDSNVGIVRR